MSRHRRRRKNNSLLGLWIALGVVGGWVFVLLIVLLVTIDETPSASSTNAGSFPFVPEVASGPQQADDFRVTLRNARFTGGSLPKLYVDVVPQQGQPDPHLRYVLICEQRGGRAALHDQSLLPDFLVRGGTQRVDIRIPFRADSTYTLRIMAAPLRQRQGARFVSNTLTVPGLRSR